MLAKFKTLFLTGLLFIIPLIVTIWVMLFLYNATIQPVAAPLVDWFLETNRILLNPTLTHIVINLVALILVVLIILLVGFLARNVFGRRLLKLGESLLDRVPLLRGVYSGVKQFLEMFLTDKEEAFKQVVLVEFPRKGSFMLAFVGSRIPGSEGREGMVNVFVPTTPNPTSGFFVMFAESEVRDVDLSVEETMHIIISAGVLFPKEVKKKLYDMANRPHGTAR